MLGSVLNQVLLHQSVIGLEAKAAMDKYGIVPAGASIQGFAFANPSS